MGFFFGSSSKNDDYDYERLRSDLMDEYGIQSAAFSGGLGFLDMCDAKDASNDEKNVTVTVKKNVTNITKILQ